MTTGAGEITEDGTERSFIDGPIWIGFEESILTELKSIFYRFKKDFPDAAKHLEEVISETDNGTRSGWYNDTKIGVATAFRGGHNMSIDTIRRIFVHELGHLLHMYFENSNMSKIIYKFTKRCMPKNLSEVSREYALQNRFEAFACGFEEWWFDSEKNWSKYAKKLCKIIGILSNKCVMTLDKIKSMWEWITELPWYFITNTSTSTSTNTSTSVGYINIINVGSYTTACGTDTIYYGTWAASA